jgi:hypothetical protein
MVGIATRRCLLTTTTPAPISTPRSQNKGHNVARQAAWMIPTNRSITPSEGQSSPDLCASSARSRSPRPVIAALLSAESYDALMDYVAENGTTVAALLESIGRVVALTQRRGRPERPDWLAAIMEDSRRIAVERRRRSRRGRSPPGLRAPSGRWAFASGPPVGNARVPGDVRQGVFVLCQRGQVWTRTAERLARDTKGRGRPRWSPTATRHTGWPG